MSLLTLNEERQRGSSASANTHSEPFLLALQPPQQSDFGCHRAWHLPPWPIEAFANGGSWKTSPTVMIAGNAKSASDAMQSTVVRELGLRPWEYGWNRDTHVVALLTRAAGGRLKHRGGFLPLLWPTAAFLIVYEGS